MSYLLTLLLIFGISGHANWQMIPGKCEACHVGHGVSGTRLLPENEPEFCLGCHGGSAAIADMINRGYLSAHAQPRDMSQFLSLPYQHPKQLGCTACHAAHGQTDQHRNKAGSAKRSPKNPQQYEFELCQTCHATNDIYLSPRSAHDVIKPIEGSNLPSLPAELEKENWLNCSDCHGGVLPSLPQGVHASTYPALLPSFYNLQDGQQESAEQYSLCYSCHQRKSILGDESFPLHHRHVVLEQTSCFTCHLSHASPTLPFLLAIEDNQRLDRISPDSQGRKTYRRQGSGGACFLTCHGVEHNGWSYDRKKRRAKF